MMTRMIPVAAAAITTTVLFATAVPAGNQSRATAYLLPGGLIEVVADFSENAIYWCGAGELARARLDRAGTERLYVWRGPAPSTAAPGQRAVTFGLTPPPSGAVDGGWSTDVDLVGNAMSVASAERACDERTTSG
ncbi:hypothetical protein ACFORG_08710 [Lutimaribacter marinistellae]|uniref:Secreted protein n=1 Tax=Lutimaribacter marinistellae TaxID=1820329 RepID=A0ABV7TGG9_9RHOB